MNFPYIKVLSFPSHQKKEQLLPWIRLGMFNPKNPDKVIYPLGLVDSGSDVSFVTHELGEELGYDIRKGVRGDIYGVGGGSIQAWYHNVGILLEDEKDKEKIEFTDFIGFTYKDFPLSMPQQTAIFGTQGLFRHVTVTFEYPVRILVNK